MLNLTINAHYHIAGIFHGVKLSRAKFPQKANFQNSFIDIRPITKQASHTRNTCNGDLCQVVQYCGYMDTHISGMRTSIASGSGMAHARPGMDSSRLNQEGGLLEFGNCLHRMAVTCFMDTTQLSVELHACGCM